MLVAEIRSNSIISFSNFNKYQFNTKIKKNNATVTFDKRAVGGYQHASIWSGAIFEIERAVPGTLEYVKTTYVNKIKITFTDGLIVSEYKAIDTL